MELKKLKENWDAFASMDPMWSILTVPGKRGRRWNAEEFFRSGQTEIKSILKAARRYHFGFKERTALDFGCGIGRITQALCKHFDKCYGVDIAPTMIAEAQKFNWHGPQCVYLHNDSPDLVQFVSDSFDFIYAFRVLQHMKPEYSEHYVAELIRILAPGGLFVFQVPSTMQATALHGDFKTPACGPLPETGFRARLSSKMKAVKVGPEQDFVVKLTVHNVSPVLWPALGLPNGDYQIFVGNHWLNSRREMLVYDDRRSALPHDVRPGQELTFSFCGVAPRMSGDFVLEIDMGQEKVTWFKDWGSPTLLLPVRVTKSDNCALSSEDCGSTAHSELGLPAVDSEPVMEMYGTEPQEVNRWISAGGGRVLKIEPDHSAPDWRSYRYWVTK